MTGRASSSNIYAAINDFSQECREWRDIPDEVRLLCVEVVGDTLTLSDEELIYAAMDLDDAANTNDRVTREVIRFAKLGDAFRRDINKSQVPALGIGLDMIQTCAMEGLRIGVATRRFRVEYPDKFDVIGDGYYASDAFNNGTLLAKRLITGYIEQQSS